jgi:isopenicillin N synthase-like dioxygenase
VSIPSDCLGIQIGECLQVVSGGLLVATPHCVRGCKNTPGVARASLPCFIDTHITFPLAMPSGCTREDVFRNTVAQRVPPLANRWTTDGVPFADFLGDTFKAYYEWAMEKSTAA